MDLVHFRESYCSMAHIPHECTDERYIEAPVASEPPETCIVASLIMTCVSSSV